MVFLGAGDSIAAKGIGEGIVIRKLAVAGLATTAIGISAAGANAAATHHGKSFRCTSRPNPSGANVTCRSGRKKVTFQVAD
jgi:hypothetical protein